MYAYPGIDQQSKSAENYETLRTMVIAPNKRPPIKNGYYEKVNQKRVGRQRLSMVRIEAKLVKIMCDGSGSKKFFLHRKAFIQVPALIFCGISK